MLLWQGVGGGGPCVTHVAQLNGDHDGVAPSAMQHITKPTGWPALAGWLGCLAGWAAWAGLGVAGLGWAGLPGWQACCWLWAWCHDMCPPPIPACTVSMWYRLGGCMHDTSRQHCADVIACANVFALNGVVVACSQCPMLLHGDLGQGVKLRTRRRPH